MRFLLVGLLIFFATGCSEDFLEQTNTASVNQNTLFKKREDGLALVTGVYNTFHDVDYMLKGIWFTANFLSQDFKNWGADAFFGTYEVPTNFAPLNVFWTRNYVGISRANAAIPILEEMKTKGILTEAEGNTLIGECYFLRGLFYYLLAVDFGGVPLELEVVKDDGRHPRNTQDEVFASVAADMVKAAGLLPWKKDQATADYGRATKGAALAYQGEALMWLKKYNEAITVYNELEGKYELEKNFFDIHQPANRNGKESIFEVQFIEYSPTAMGWGQFGVNNQWIASFGMPEELSTFGYAYADKKLYDSYEPGDLRKKATVIGPGDKHPSIDISSYPKAKEKFVENGVTINTLGTANAPWKGSDKGRSGYYGMKFWRNPDIVGLKGISYFLSADNVMLMRYGQVLLSKAEAYHHTGKPAESMAIIQRIRERGFGKLETPSVVVPTPGVTDPMKIILNEYRHELSGETSLWFMLRRTGQHLQYVREEFGITVPTGKDLMPIPQLQIGLNQKLVQNPGY
jgi:hypothetical protein